MTGSRYGGFDLQWLLHALTVDEAGHFHGAAVGEIIDQAVVGDVAVDNARLASHHTVDD